MRSIAVDTEYEKNIPFIATTTDEQLHSVLYRLDIGKWGKENLRAICESSKINKVFHSATSDIYALSNIGINVVPPYDDTFIMSSLINENFESKKLKSLAKIYLEEPCNESKLLSKLKAKYKREAKKSDKQFSYKMIPSEVLYPYAIKDTEYTMKLFHLFHKPIKQVQQLYDFEKELIPIIVEMQQRGIKINRSLVKRRIKETQRLIFLTRNKLNKELTRNQYTEIFNHNSSHHVRKLLEHLNLFTHKLTKHGDFSTSADVLETFNHPTIKLILVLRGYEKKQNTYYLPLYEYYTSPTDDRAHFSYWQSGAKTGRMSAELIQTIPKRKEGNEVRKVFIPEKGYYLLVFDYEQIEMRLFAHFSNCKLLIKDILNGYDPHMGTAKQIFSPEEIKKNNNACRQAAKTINFGIIYGMGRGKLTATLKTEPRVANELLANYYKKYPVREYIQSIIGRIYKTGFLDLDIDSSRMQVHRRYHVPQHLAYKGANVEIQGTAAYVMKYGMKRISDKIKKEKLDIHFLDVVHDEFGFEVSNAIPKKEAIDLITAEMEDRISFKVPILASAKWSSKSWGELKTWTD